MWKTDIELHNGSKIFNCDIFIEETQGLSAVRMTCLGDHGLIEEQFKMRPWGNNFRNVFYQNENMNGQINITGIKSYTITNTNNPEELLNTKRVSLNELITSAFGFQVNDNDFDCIKEDSLYYLSLGFSVRECVEAAKNYYDNHPSSQDDIPYCFGNGMDENLDH